ncbi:MAG: carboxypeptidase regulatory-like domain-containing protein [Acidobacteriia bacterium]|nr:carboxypeptidase regulatory-like domain-containing protein [Terriglobia bacterium]
MKVNQILMSGIAVLAAATMAVAAPGGGTVSGKVTYEGTPAKQKPIDMSKEPSCAKAHATPITTEAVVTGEGNTLENVVVYISAGAPDGATAPAQAVTITQRGCQYVPHLVALQVNQELKVVNEDQTSHNIHPLAKANREWNKSQPPGSPAFTEKFDKEEFIPVKCNIHPWMHSTFAVMKTSHYSVTAGNGGFTLPNLPPGKYTITAWHESYGTQTQDVTITGSETKTISFVFKAKPY